MKSNTYYADYIVHCIEHLLRRIYVVINVFWFLTILFFLLGYWYEKELWFSAIKSKLFLVNLSNWQMIALFFAPFYLKYFFGVIVGIISKVRKAIFSKKSFDVIVRAKVINKEKIYGGSSESDWVEYYLFINHPVSHKAIRFKVTEKMYSKYNINDMAEVNSNPNIGSVLILNELTDD